VVPGGTAGAVTTQVVPLAKRALVADNAKKVGGLTATQLGAAAAQAGAKVVMSQSPARPRRGFNNPTNALVISAGSFAPADGTGWTEDLINLSTSTAGAGTVVVTCLK